jgi:lysophospholipid acyltransferase
LTCTDSFLGWAFFFPTILVGPSFDYSLYSSLVHNTLYLDPPTAKDPGDKKSIPKANPVGRKRVALTHMVVGTAFLGFYAVLGSKATYAGVLSDAWWSFSPVFRYCPSEADLLFETVRVLY